MNTKDDRSLFFFLTFFLLRCSNLVEILKFQDRSSRRFQDRPSRRNVERQIQIKMSETLPSFKIFFIILYSSFKLNSSTHPERDINFTILSLFFFCRFPAPNQYFNYFLKKSVKRLRIMLIIIILILIII